MLILYAFLWVIPWRLNNSDARELPRTKHTTFRTRQKFEIKNANFHYFINTELHMTIVLLLIIKPEFKTLFIRIINFVF